jgi:hypothetical protein
MFDLKRSNAESHAAEETPENRETEVHIETTEENGETISIHEEQEAPVSTHEQDSGGHSETTDSESMLQGRPKQLRQPPKRFGFQ